jgi:hypothetical protein
MRHPRLDSTTRLAFAVHVARCATGRPWDEIADAAKTLAEHVEILDAARKIHVPDGALDCVGCMAAAGLGDVGDPHIPWPCATAKALGTPRVEMAVRWDQA